MSKFVVVEVGCIECSCETFVLGVFDTREEAEQACAEAGVTLGDWFGRGREENAIKGQHDTLILETVGVSVPSSGVDE